MGALTEKQKQFLQKHNMWNAERDKSSLNIFETGNFKDFFRRKEKIEAELERLPDQDAKRGLLRRLQDAEAKAKNKDFNDAYKDLKAVKVDARREANGYSGSLSLRDLGQQIDAWGAQGDSVDSLLTRLDLGMKTVRDQLAKQGKASDAATIGEAAEFLREFKGVEFSLRAAVTGQKHVVTQITTSLKQSDPAKQSAEISLQISLMRKEHGADVDDLEQRANAIRLKFSKLPGASDVQKRFDDFDAEIDKSIRLHKDLGKFQSREPSDVRTSDDILMRNPGAWDDNPSEVDDLLAELAKGDSKLQFDTAVLELKDIEIALAGEKAKNSPEFATALKQRRAEAIRIIKLLDLRDARRFEQIKTGFVGSGLNDKQMLAKTQDAPKKHQPLATFDADAVVSELTLPTNLKKVKAPEIRQVRQDLKLKMDELLTAELKKADSDLVFDLGLKTKEEFFAELAETMGIDPASKKFSAEEKELLNQMAEQMVASVREKYPNQAGQVKAKIQTKDNKQTEVPTEFMLGGKKYTSPKYLASGGVGDVLRYQEDGADPPKYTVVKTLQDQTKREDMVRELKLHRQANGGENGANNPYVVELQGAVLGPEGEIYMAMEFADGGDLNDMGYTLAQAALGGNISEEARQVLTQNMLREAIIGMKQVQDNNMTHHDLKGMNYLVGGDGKVKVADFGSGQIGDDKGEVPSSASHMITTAAYKAPELGGPKPVTGKADTYSLGVMLQKIASPMQGHGPQGRGGNAPVTALDKLRASMLDQDPDKRPMLEAVLQTAYMSDVSDNYEQEQIDQLMQALMAYNKHVASKAKKEMRMVVYYEGELAVLQKKRAGAAHSELPEIDGKIEKALQSIKEQRDRIDQLMAEDDSKPYVKGLRDANQRFLGRGSVSAGIDLAKVKFKKEYDAIVKASGLPADAPLLKTLTEVDQAGAGDAKKKQAALAAVAALKLAEETSKQAKASVIEKDKLALSRLGADLRKLKQALKEMAESK